MDRHFTESERKALKEGLMQQLTDEEKRAVRNYAKLWDELPEVPFPLRTLLGRLTKKQLSDIRKILGISGASTLPKAELIDCLTEAIPQAVAWELKTFDKQQYDVLKKAAAGAGYVEAVSVDLFVWEHLHAKGLIFPGAYNDKPVLAVPAEVLAVFRQEDNCKLASLVDQNTKLVQAATGLLFYYGVLEHKQLNEMLRDLVGVDCAMPQNLAVLYNAMCCYENIDFAGKLWFYCQVNDPKAVYEQQLARSGLPYRKLTLKQVLQAGADEDYYEPKPELMQFMQYIHNCYDMTREEAEDLVFECLTAIYNDENIDEVIAILQEWLEIPDINVMKEITGYLLALCNATHRYILKGHSPNQVRALEAQTDAPASNVYSFSTGQKLGRNDPCPCGSGKKFKKCCGK